MTKSFYPLGQSPTAGSAFYFKQAEIFSKPGARVTLYLSSIPPAPPPGIATGSQAPTSSPVKHVVNWEYWNGEQWTLMLQSTNSNSPSKDFAVTETIEFTVPTDMRSTKVNNDDGYWIRVRLMSGGYGVNQSITVPTTPPTQVDFVQPQPPAVGAFTFGYSWVRGPEPLESVLTFNDLRSPTRRTMLAGRETSSRSSSQSTKYRPRCIWDSIVFCRPTILDCTLTSWSSSGVVRARIWPGSTGTARAGRSWWPRTKRNTSNSPAS